MDRAQNPYPTVGCDSASNPQCKQEQEEGLKQSKAGMYLSIPHQPRQLLGTRGPRSQGLPDASL